LVPPELKHKGARLKRYAERAGLGAVSPHTLRHSFAAQKLMSGTDVRDLQQVLGHASISTTQVYARLGEGKSRKRS
jgi:integrase/recombinase XerD